jgi:catechol 2,3-dioxygenase-like lactoylglutathione lyase family enzyme
MTPQSAAAVFQVSNLEGSLKYYKDVLGFSQEFRFGDYAGLKFGEAHLHLAGHNAHNRPVGGGSVYVFCDEVDAYHAELKRKGARLKSEPKDYPYGMRDFAVADPDGNLLGFGCESKTA